MMLREVATSERPRERMRSFGVGSLSDAELLAVLLQNGCFGENVIDLSHRLIASYGLESLSSLSLNELMQLKGIGMAKACKIRAAFELANRVSSGKIIGKEITSARDVFRYFSPKMGELKKEHFCALLLDSKNRVIKEEIISIGTLNSSLVHPREVFKEAIRNSANAIILVHNHPSGDCKPSSDDSEIFARLAEAGDMLNIKVLDQVIIARNCYWSWKEKREL
ncbi:DNA repair protein RadC [Candidatus Woesearchaeota archaeon]|nr:DNA repair protein RadC [Candidatus Woesearchaeota archaeon]